MDSSPVKFFIAFLALSAVGWVVFTFAARMLSWFLSRVLNASVCFRVAGFNCLRDVNVKFMKGSVESVTIGEIKLSLRKSLVKLSFGFISKDPKLQLLISDFEIILRPSKKTQKISKLQKPRSTGKGKWLVVTSMARYLSVCVADLNIKVPKAAFDVKELKLDIFKIAGPSHTLGVKLHLVPFSLQFGDSNSLLDQVNIRNNNDVLSADQPLSDILEKTSFPFVCEDLMINFAFGHEREKGVRIVNLDIACGSITANVHEKVLLRRGKDSYDSVNAEIRGKHDLSTETVIEELEVKKSPLSNMKKLAVSIPDKVSFSVPKLNVTFLHLGEGLTIENNVMGINLTSVKSFPPVDMEGASNHFDVQLDLTEIHVHKEGTSSTLEVLKVAAAATLDIPVDRLLPVTVEVDAKLGGAQCNLILSRVMPLLRIMQSKKKPMRLAESRPPIKMSQGGMDKQILWTVTVSAPEMSVMLYSLDGFLLYHGCSQSSHLFANNIASQFASIHAEFGELQLDMGEEFREIRNDNVFGVDAYSSIMHIARLSLDWGCKETELQEVLAKKLETLLLVDISGLEIRFGYKHLESFFNNLVSFRILFEGLPFGKSSKAMKLDKVNKSKSKGINVIKLNLEKCLIAYNDKMAIIDSVTADPKRVNYGSQGGEVIVDVSADGTPRTATITSLLPNDAKTLSYTTSFAISCLSVCINKEKKSMEIQVDRIKLLYDEWYADQKSGAQVVILDLENAKLVRRFGGLADVSVCSLLSATNITLRWEIDVHLMLHDSFIKWRQLLHRAKNNESSLMNNSNPEICEQKLLNEVSSEKKVDKKESIFAIDIEKLKISAELADGVEANIFVQSIFTENAKIGVLLEDLILRFNGATVLRSGRLQISCIPISKENMRDVKGETSTKRDWVVHGLDVHVCMPFRLPLRAIQDAIEDMVRALKLVIAAKGNHLHTSKKQNKKVKHGSTKFGNVRFVFRKLLADIEEEPIQGWLDEHYHLLRHTVCESDVRLKFLDELSSTDNRVPGSVGQADTHVQRKINFDGNQVDLDDEKAVQKLQEEIYKQTFQTYYSACQKMVFAEGSGASSKGFQSGFKLSTKRSSLLSLRASDLDVTFIKIGGDSEKIDFIKEIDPICKEKKIPFSRLFGRDIAVHVSSLVLQLRDYTFPLFSATNGRCQGRIIFAQQATCFQPQRHQDVYIGRWHKIKMLRSASGTTPPMKMYSNLPMHFEKGEVSFGVGYEPAFADISYALQVALRRANLSTRSDFYSPAKQPPKKERGFPWWDDMRYYIHGKIAIYFNESKWSFLATTNPYESLERLQIVSDYMDFQKTDGHVDVFAKEFKIFISSLESMMKNCSLKVPSDVHKPFIYSPSFTLNVNIDWDCESGNPLDHYLHALPVEGEPRKRVLDLFRSTSLSLRWNFSLRPVQSDSGNIASDYFGSATVLDKSIYKSSFHLHDCTPTMNLGGHDLAWVFRWWSLNYSPPHKLRAFCRWPRFRVQRSARSGNLSLDKVLTQFFFRVDATPCCIRHVTLGKDDPASGLIFRMSKLKYELFYSRGKQRYAFDSKRESLDLVYRGLDLHLPKVYVIRDGNSSSGEDNQSTRTKSQDLPIGAGSYVYENEETGFLLSSDYFTIRRQAPKADPEALLAWQEAGRKTLEITYVRSEFENGSESEHTRSDPSDEDGFNVVIADNCQRVFVYGLKLLWTIENRDAVWSWVGAITKAFEPSKPSPSRQYAQRKMIEEKKKLQISKSCIEESGTARINSSVAQKAESTASTSSAPASTNSNSAHSVAADEEGKRRFMVNVIQPQFNLHSEEANGRFLLAAASGRVLARSFHSVLHVGYEMIEQALGTSSSLIRELQPEMTWKRAELSVMLRHVQAHVAPTDVDPGAGLQWLPKILRSSEKLKRTGALLERVFMPCQMYFRYTRHKGGTAELKVKPLKELSFNSPNITATMTSRQFQVMLDVLSNLLFARLPKPRRSSLQYPSDDDEDIEEEADEMVPDGVEEVELAKIHLEQKERERKLILDDIRTLLGSDIYRENSHISGKDDLLWMINGEKPILVDGLKRELLNVQISRKAASSALRKVLQKNSHLRLMEKEKNKSPSCAMRISMQIKKVVWSMLADGKTFAEAEINDMIYDFDRDYSDIGIARFTTKAFVIRNCLLNAKSDMLLSAWNAPPEWGKNVMVRVDAKQGAPKDGSSPLELFQVDIYPLKIYLTESMYRMMWDYFFPEEEDSQRRQEIWRVSTSTGPRRIRRISTGEGSSSGSNVTRESDVSVKPNGTTPVVANGNSRLSAVIENSQMSKLQSLKANIVCGSNPDLRRTPSFDRTGEDGAVDSGASELVLQASSNGSSKSGPLNSTPESQLAVLDTGKGKAKDSRPIKSGRLSHEEKKVVKSQDEKRARTRKMMEFHNIKISQVELLVTYEGSRFAVNDLRLLMDTFHRIEFTGTWRRLFSRVKKHIIWGVLKSVTGMQGKKFKDKVQNQMEGGSAVPENDLNFSDSDGSQPGKSDHFPVSWLKRPSDGAGDGFVTSIKGLFNSQRRKAKAFVRRTMRGDHDSDSHGEWSESDAEYPQLARQLTITKAKKLFRRGTKKFRSRGKNPGLAMQKDSRPTSPREASTPFESDSSGASSYEDFHE